MTAPDMVLVIGAISVALMNLGGLVLQIITVFNVREVKKHTNSMQDAMLASAKKEGAQEEKDKQA